MAKRNLIEQAWAKGILGYKLYDYQIPLYDAIQAAIADPDCSRYVLNCARQLGKSTILCLIALECALRKPNQQISFTAPTAKQLRKIVRQRFVPLCKDAPTKYKPVYKTMDGVYEFYNGSLIYLAGADNDNAENLRGATTHLNLLDEAAFMDDLEWVVNDVLRAQTLTTGGKTILASTPPDTPDHYFTQITQDCMAEGYYSEYDIYHNTRLTKRDLDAFAKDLGGYTSSRFKREALCQFVVDETLQVVPEWSEAYAQDLPKPELYALYHKYVAMDLGYKDFTAVLFGYYNFNTTQLVIEAEYAINGPELTTDRLAQDIRAQEQALWGNETPYRRISDNNDLITIQNLLTLNQLPFVPTNKDSLHAMVNEVRMFINAGRLIVSPSCQKLLACLKFGVWNKQRDKFARSSQYGHYDHLAALVYLIRNLDQYTNPIPEFYKFNPNQSHIPSPSRTQQAQVWTKILTRRAI